VTACPKSRGLRIALLLALLSCPAWSSQSQAQPGQLHITSVPQGERIVINDSPRTEVTDVTLVVSPGTYKVTVGNCSAQSVQVSSGETKEVHCP